tara:strand:+ start:171 stop:323 length:153 start_codon:yes stop_codon:yes gene_type:complete
LKIPDPNKPPMPPHLNDFESIRILIMTVDYLTKKVDELEARIDTLERGKK